jgi:hypothetical protein
MRNWNVLDKLPIYLMKMSLGDFSAKVGRVDIFKSTNENESLHESSIDNWVRVVNIVTSKNVTEVQRSHITVFIHKLGPLQMGKPTNRLIIF